MITILSPRVKRSGGSVLLAARPPDLNGRTIGLLDNGKRNFDVYLDCTEELLKERFTFAAIRRRKPSPLKGIPRDLLDEMAEQCNTIITGSGDWGSCSSWSVHDLIEFEKRGIPGAVICTDVFEYTARVQAKALGIAGARIVIVPHPFSGVDPGEVTKKAKSAIDQVIAALIKPRPIPERPV